MGAYERKSFYGIGKIFHNIFYYFLPCAHPHATAGTRRTRTGHGFSGSRGGACPHSCTSSHLFCLSGRRCQVEQKSWGTSLFGHRILNDRTFNIRALFRFRDYSNSIVAGGFPVQSYMTRLMCLTSFTIRLVVLPMTSHGISALSAVMKSVVVTARRAMA